MASGDAIVAPARVGRRSRLARALAELAVGFVVADVVLVVLDRKGIGSNIAANQLPFLVTYLLLGLLGGLVASRRPENPIGWMFLTTAVLGAGATLSGLVGIRGLLAGASPAGWVEWTIWSSGLASVLPISMLMFTFFLFPDGRLQSSRWRLAFLASVFFLLLIVVLGAMDPAPVVVSPSLPKVPNPVGVGLARGFNDGSKPITDVWFTLAIAFVLVIWSLVARFRRARGEERQQVKWVVYAVTSSSVLAAVSVVFATADPAAQSNHILTIVGFLISIQFGIGILVPAVVAVAILKYRLYDIDRVINRTLVYGALSVVLAAVYVGLAVGLGSLIQSNNSLVVAGSTLVVAALFRPARRRVQAFIDRRFYRRRYDAARTLEAFTARLRDEVDLDELSSHLVEVVRETMQPAQASLWIRGAEAGS